jgi:iron(III) transport system substrate-binding protein
MPPHTLKRRDLLTAATALGAVALGALSPAGRAAAAPKNRPPPENPRPLVPPREFVPAAGLVEAAQAEGRLVVYTSTVQTAMQDTIRAFTRRFPFARVEMVRASGSQLTTRVEAEAAHGVLAADVIDHSDRDQAKHLERIFRDYAPPNAADYLPAALCSPRLWPTIAPGWCLAYNAELLPDGPRSWRDLAGPAFGNGQIGQVTGVSGGTTWTRILFERKVLGEDFWPRQAATRPRLFPSSAPLADALIRGEVTVGPIIYDAILSPIRDGAPLKAHFGKEGVPLVPYASGIPRAAQHPNTARLFLDWLLSAEGQRFAVQRRGTFSMLKRPPAMPEGYDPATAPLWVPDFAQSEALHGPWVREWSRVYGVRQ